MANKVTQAGDLDRLGNLYKWDEHVGSMGGMGKSLTQFQSGIPCNKNELGPKSDETEANERVTAFGQVEFTLRYRTDVKETMVFECEGTKYNILNVREGEGRRQWTVLTCQRHD